MSLLRSLLFFFGAAVAAALAVLCLWVDIRVFGNDIPEVSLTEVVQESVLAVIVLVHLLLARNMPTCAIAISSSAASFSPC
ncbi:putative transport protein [Klebsiella pneumoniae]|nr:putative transport protein [Klebsiella pneumoniae]